MNRAIRRYYHFPFGLYFLFWDINFFRAIEFFLGGQSPAQIGFQLNIRLQTIYLWIRRFKADGLTGLRAKPQKGNPKISNKARFQEIRMLLEGGPRAIGLDKDFWNGPTVVQALKKQWNIRIHPKYVYRWLDKNGHKELLKRHPGSPIDSTDTNHLPKSI